MIADTYKLLGSVLGANEIEQLRGIINEGGPAVTLNKGRMSEEGSQERNVGLDSTDTELDQSSKHLASSDLVSGTMTGALHQHAVVMCYSACQQMHNRLLDVNEKRGRQSPKNISEH